MQSFAYAAVDLAAQGLHVNGFLLTSALCEGEQIISLTEEVVRAQQSSAGAGPSHLGAEAVARQAAVPSTSAAAAEIITAAPTIQLSSILPSTVWQGASKRALAWSEKLGVSSAPYVNGLWCSVPRLHSSSPRGHKRVSSESGA